MRVIPCNAESLEGETYVWELTGPGPEQMLNASSFPSHSLLWSTEINDSQRFGA